MKRRKTRHRVRGGVYQDGLYSFILIEVSSNVPQSVVTKQIISEKEAKDLFRMYVLVSVSPSALRSSMILAVSFTVVLRFFLCSMQTRIPMKRCMTVLRLL